MNVGFPYYVSLPSSGGTLSVSPWQKVDDIRNPVNISFSIYNSSASPISSATGGVYLQVTLDDPFGYQPNPIFSSPAPGPQGPSSNPFVVALPASAFSTTTFGTSGAPLTTGFPVAGSILDPITAWRIASTSSIGTVVVTALQSGPR